MAPKTELLELPPSAISPNPDNPRVVFRQKELDRLLRSISKYGIQVPVTVYRDRKDRYVLIDGERRWRCARKLNLLFMPAIVTTKPSDLDNLLLMFNIHALRDQWDYLTIATKLPTVIALYKNQHTKEPTETDLSEITGLSRGQVRRCKLILGLPDRYRTKLLEELKLPKNEQRLGEDFFIEMEKALKTIAERLPATIEDMDDARDVLIEKYQEEVIRNITDFRKLRKIATSVESLGVGKTKAAKAIQRVLSSDHPNIGIIDVYEQEFEGPYDAHAFNLNLSSIRGYLTRLASAASDGSRPKLQSMAKKNLLAIRKLIDEVLDV